MRLTHVLLTLVLFATACAGNPISKRDVSGSETEHAISTQTNLESDVGHMISVADVTGPDHWGDSTSVTHLKHLHFSGQPDMEAMQVAKANGVTTIISLREPGESDWDEGAAAKELGLKFINIPIAKKSDSIDSGAVARIESVIKAGSGEQVLLHCSTGNRATAWLALHLVDSHKIPEDQALAIARKAGLSSSGMEQRVRQYHDDRK